MVNRDVYFTQRHCIVSIYFLQIVKNISSFLRLNTSTSSELEVTDDSALWKVSLLYDYDHHYFADTICV